MTDEPWRQSEHVDPGRVATHLDFGRELTLARERAGLTVREVARAAGLPASTTGDYFAARHLPPASQPDVLPRILAACGETDPARIDEWVLALARARRSPGRRPSGAAAPYRGLASYQPEDAGWFFGREELTDLLAAKALSSAGLPLVVVGPSGSGKSSVLRAGLIPRLGAMVCPDGYEDSAAVVLLTPGPAPLSALAAQFCPPDSSAAADTAAALRVSPEAFAELVGTDTAIVVDQFEETFAACDDEEERRAFVSALSAASGRAIVVLGLRADFYASALRHPQLAKALQDQQVVVGPMTPHQLRRAIVEPARQAGVHVEEGLVELLLADLAPNLPPSADAGHEPGALPLLSHALLATWERCRGGRLTVADYLASGGIRDAIARTAESVYTGLSEHEQAAAHSLFLRLVRVTADGAGTRCRVPLSDLSADRGESADWMALGSTSDGVLAKFVAERLVTVDADTAEITHEALLHAWPRLSDWIDADRAGLRIRRRITEAAAGWEEAGRDDGALVRGGQLAIAKEWAAADPLSRASLGALAREFIAAATAREDAERRAAARRTRRLRELAAALAVLTVAAAGLAGFALRQREAADAARANADSRGVAIEADQVRGQEVSLAAQLSLAAYQIARTPAALASVLDSSATPMAARLIDSLGVVEATALSPDHDLLAVAADDGTVRLWNIRRPARPVPVGRPLVRVADDPLYTAAFSPNGKLVAAAGAEGDVLLWRLGGVAGPVRLPQLAGPTSTVYSVAFSPNGRLLAAGSADDHVWIWDVANPGHARLIARLSGPSGYVESVAFSPDGDLLAAGSADKTVWLWNLADPADPQPVGGPLTGPTQIVTSVAFSQSGTELAAGSQDDNVWLWNLAHPAKPVPVRPLTGATDWVNAVAFSPNGTILAAGSSDDTVRLWDVATGALIATLPHSEPVTSLAWDGQDRLVTGDADGIVRLWVLPTPVLAVGGPVNSVAYSPDGSELVVGGPSLELWNTATRAMTASATPGGTFVNAVAVRPASRAVGATGQAGGSAGTVVAAGYGDGDIQLWSAAGGRLAALGAALSGTARGMIEFLAFSPDGKILASGADDGTVRLWDVANPARPRLLAKIHDAGTYVFSVAFEPDGRVLAAGSADDKVRLWNVANPARPVALGRPLTGPASYVYSVAFSPNGKTLAAGVTDGTVWLWRVSSPARPVFTAQLTGPTGHVYSVAFSPSGDAIAAASADGTVRVWDTSPLTAAKAICANAGQPLTRVEWASYVPGRPYSPPCPSS